MPHEIYPMHILDRNRRKHAQREEYIFRDYLGILKPKGYMGPRRERKLRLRAYAFTHIDMLENTMLDTIKDLAIFGVPNAHKLFKEQLSDMKITKNNVALYGYLDKDIKRKILWHQIGDAWGHAYHDVEKLPLIKLDAEEAENVAA